MKDRFRQLMDEYSGKPGYILGKGPSLQFWDPQHNGVIIGVNDVGKYVPCDFSLSCDGYYNEPYGTQGHLVGVPETDCLCPDCFEKRLGRKLLLSDLTDCLLNVMFLDIMKSFGRTIGED